MGPAASCTGKGRMLHVSKLFLSLTRRDQGRAQEVTSAEREAVDRATPSHVLKFIDLIVKGTGRVALDREPQLLDGI